jgi:ABC-type uncharacterized transport system substrate-binding protein
LWGAPKRRHLLTLILSLAGSAAFAPAVFAHPHVWATVRSEIELAPNHQITGIRQAWTFDEFYTAMAVEGLDTNKDGVYSKEELAPLAKVNVESLKEFDYFTFVHFEGEDDKLIKLKPPVDYWIDYDKNVLTLHFTLPLETPVDTHGKPVAIDVYDPSFFVAFGFATEKPVTLAGSDIKGCDAKVTLPDPETAADTKALTESFFTQLGPNSNGHHDHTHGHRDHDHEHDHHGHHHAPGEACDHIVDARQLAGPFSWRKVMAVVFSVGIRPCTGAILVLVFAVTQGLFWAGVAATFAMAFGTAITVAVLATFALGSRELALKLGGASGTWANAVWTTCTIGGAVVIFLFGALLFAASLGPARPF